MNFPPELNSGHGCTFIRCDYDGLNGHGEKVTASYEGRVTWADSDQWEEPDWLYHYKEELRSMHGKECQIWFRKGDKGRAEICFLLR